MNRSNKNLSFYFGLPLRQYYHATTCNPSEELSPTRKKIENNLISIIVFVGLYFLGGTGKVWERGVTLCHASQFFLAANYNFLRMNRFIINRSFIDILILIVRKILKHLFQKRCRFAVLCLVSLFKLSEMEIFNLQIRYHHYKFCFVEIYVTET